MNAQEKAQCVEWFIESKSDTQVQRNFKTNYNKNPPSRTTIRAWYKKFTETGNVEHKKGAGRPRTSEEKVESIREAFLRSPRKSTRIASRELQIPRSTMHDVLRKRLKFYPYKLQILQHITENDKVVRKEFAMTMLDKVDEENDFLTRIMFSDEATFHVSGKVNKQNVRIWGSENPKFTRRAH
jgi:transposase